MAAVPDVDLLSILHYTLQARPHHSNLVSGFFNVPCLTKLLIDANREAVMSMHLTETCNIIAKIALDILLLKLSVKCMVFLTNGHSQT